MSKKALWIITALLFAACFGITFVYMPSRKTDLERKGHRAYGTVEAKDSRPIADGTYVYFVTFIYQDDRKKNYQVTVRVFDRGRWDNLRIKQDLKDVYYIPGQEALASIPGAERMVAPHSSALSYLAWSFFFAACVTSYMAFVAQKPEQKEKPQARITVAKH
jgi:hypothetical protein